MSPQLSGANEREKYRQINRDKEAMPRVDEVELVTSNGYARVRLQSSESEDAEDEIDLGLVGEKVSRFKDNLEENTDDDEYAEEDHHLLRTDTLSQSPRRNTRRKSRSKQRNRSVFSIKFFMFLFLNFT